MPESSFVSLEGWVVYCTTWDDCDCYVEKAYDPVTGQVELIKAQICGRCYDTAMAQLDERTTSREAQLTLPLPSPEDGRGDQ